MLGHVVHNQITSVTIVEGNDQEALHVHLVNMHFEFKSKDHQGIYTSKGQSKR